MLLKASASPCQVSGVLQVTCVGGRGEGEGSRVEVAVTRNAWM